MTVINIILLATAIIITIINLINIKTASKQIEKIESSLFELNMRNTIERFNNSARYIHNYFMDTKDDE